MGKDVADGLDLLFFPNMLNIGNCIIFQHFSITESEDPIVICFLLGVSKLKHNKWRCKWQGNSVPKKNIQSETENVHNSNFQ